MRITDPMLIGNMTYNLNSSLNRMEMLQFQSTGKKFRVPSDDPIGASKSLRLRTDMSKVEQYKRNVNDAMSWMKETESALDEINEILHRTNELVNQAATETYSEDDLLKIKEEIKELKGSIIKVANTTYTGRSIFTGYKTGEKLLDEDGNYTVDLSEKAIVTIDDPAGTGKIDVIAVIKGDNYSYKDANGNEQTIGKDTVAPKDVKNYDGQFEYKIGQEESIKVNNLGNTIFGTVDKDGNPDYKTDGTKGQKAYLVSLFEDIEKNLEDRDTEALQEKLTAIDGARGNILSVTSQIGAKSNRMKITSEKLEDQKVNLKDLLSEVEDSNIPEVYMQLMLEKNVYNASLSIGAQILQPSLADFIR